MATVIGVKSGKEFLVEDDSYLFVDEKSGLQTRMFVSLDRKRVITIPPDVGNIEYYDEVATEAFIKELRETKHPRVFNKTEAVEDVNVR
jgi:hypothetical protein